MSENVFDKALISDEEWDRLKISRLSSRPNAQTAYGSGGYDAKAMKEAFDAQGNLLKERHNTLVNYARAEEGARAAAESERRTAEIKRENAENGYTDINGDFVSGRVQNEDKRVDAENQRQINEFGAEGNRYDGGQGCVVDANGDKVKNDQAGRVGAELQRQMDEADRKSNETSRETRFSEMEKLVGDLPEALEAILALQESLIGGDEQ